MRFFIIALVVVVFAAFMVTFTVKYNETAVVSTFGRANAGDVINGADKAGLYLKVPYVQRVTKYDTRLRFLEPLPEQQQTFDDKPLIVTAYVTWRVKSALDFYKLLSGRGPDAKDHYTFASEILSARLRTAMSEVSKFRLDELLSASEGGSKIPNLEKNILAQLERAAADQPGLSEYGIEVVSVGVSAVGMPLSTTGAVIARMVANRSTIANKTIDQGKSEAASIRAKAESDAKRITAFAERLARNIRTQGEIESAKFLEQTKTEPELAVFIQNMDFLREAMGKTTTLVLPASLPGFEFFRPDAMRSVRSGSLPVPTLEQLKTVKPAAGAETGEPAAGAAAGRGGQK